MRQQNDKQQLIRRLNYLRGVMYNLGAIGVRNNKETGSIEYGSVSARFGDGFICNARNTNSLPEILEGHYYSVSLEGHDCFVSQEKTAGCTAVWRMPPSSSFMTHDYLYRANPRIQCVAEGEFSPIHSYYQSCPEEAVIIQEGQLDLEIQRKGRDNKMLQHDLTKLFFNEAGCYGILIPKICPHSFYIVGESIEDVLAGLLVSGNKSLGGMMSFFNKELSNISYAME